jgi:hypothetical protein
MTKGDPIKLATYAARLSDQQLLGWFSAIRDPDSLTDVERAISEEVANRKLLHGKP